MKFSRFLAVQRLVLIVGMCVLFTGLTTATFAAPADNAFVRVVHASPAAGNVDVFVDGASLLSNFAFSTVTGYVPLAAGSHKIQVAPTGKGIGSAVITQTVSVNAGVPYTVAAVGTTASGFSLQAFADNNLLTGGMAKVRVYHLSPNAGPVDVAAGGKTVISGLTYQNASDYLTVPPAVYTFNVTATQANVTVPVTATVNDGTVNSVFAVGLYQGDPALKFVAASVAGVPSMPNTGSNPQGVSQNNSSLIWLLSVLAVVLLGAGTIVGRILYARKK